MAQRILITGGSGMVGLGLTEVLLSEGYEVVWLGRSGKRKLGVTVYKWDIEKQQVDSRAFKNLHAIIHLAGEGIANKRWTTQQRIKIIDSRVKSANLLYNKLQEYKSTIKILISASGAGYYGYDNGDKELTEKTISGNDFLAEVVKKWEASADQFSSLGIRVIKLRLAMVLSKTGGALKKIALPIKWGVGSPLGNGKQLISWIHIYDLCQMILHVLRSNKIKGVYNAATTDPVTNAAITQTIANTLNKTLFFPNVPSLVLRLLLGEMSNLVLGGGIISPEKIINSGFTFKHETIELAIKDLLKTK